MKTHVLSYLRSAAFCLLMISQIQKLQSYTIFDCAPQNDYPPACENCWEPCCSPFWGEIDYLFWKTNNSPRVPPLVFTGIYDASITPSLQTPGTTILLGNRTSKDHGRSGARFTIGHNLYSCQLYSTEVIYFFLEKERHSKSVQSNDFADDDITTPTLPDNSYLAIPFFDAVTNKASSVYIAKPSSNSTTDTTKFSGKATLKTRNWMQGFEWNISRTMDIGCLCEHFKLSALIGFRYWNFNDKLFFITDSPDIDTNPNQTAPNVFHTVDIFRTISNFYGPQIGVNAEWHYHCFFFQVKAKIAVGGVNQKLTIEGTLDTNEFSNQQNNSGKLQEFPLGYFALATNSGNFEKNRLAYIPEILVNFMYQINDSARLKIGYSCLYVNKVFWAENQIDTHINPSQSVAITRSPNATLTGIEAPRPLRKSRQLFVHGLNIGIEFGF